jgi:3-hydroxyisobutyrate dehydrogenase-like beta-hydroxyacid dehydrogenase
MAAETNKQSVAFIGLGRMGLPMAQHVLKAGFPAHRLESYAAEGGTPRGIRRDSGKEPAEAASGADVVISSLMDDEAVLSIATGKTGILHSLRPSAIHVGASTVSPKLSDKLERLHRKNKTHYIAGPVLGRPDAAEAGRLMTFVAGDASAIERARPVVASYAPTIIVTGEQPRAANVAKLLANFTLASALDLIGQSLALAEKSKLDPRLAIQMLSGFFGVPAVKEYVTRIAERDFVPPGFEIAGGLKDIELMIAAARDVNLEADQRGSDPDKNSRGDKVGIARQGLEQLHGISIGADREKLQMSLTPFVPTPKFEDYKERFKDHFKLERRADGVAARAGAHFGRVDSAERSKSQGSGPAPEDHRRRSGKRIADSHRHRRAFHDGHRSQRASRWRRKTCSTGPTNTPTRTGASMSSALINDLEIPTIGAFNGSGGHAEVLLMCDITLVRGRGRSFSIRISTWARFRATGFTAACRNC